MGQRPCSRWPSRLDSIHLLARHGRRTAISAQELVGRFGPRSAYALGPRDRHFIAERRARLLLPVVVSPMQRTLLIGVVTLAVACGSDDDGSAGGGGGSGDSGGSGAMAPSTSATAGADGLPSGTSGSGVDETGDSSDGTDPNCIEVLDPDPGLADPVVALAAAFGASCGIQASGLTQCWGRPPVASPASLVPQPLAGAPDLLMFDGMFEAGCGMDTVGAIWCIGWNHGGQLGVGAPLGAETASMVLSVPVMPNRNRAVDFAMGWHHGCLIDTHGEVACWGSIVESILPDGVTLQSAVPIYAQGVEYAVDVGAGFAHACAVLADGGVRCWGRNAAGQVGDGTLTDRGTPVAVTGLAGAVQIATGFDHNCVVIEDGTVQCWGNNTGGQLGDGTLNVRSFPAPVMDIDDARMVVAGDFHSCALRACGRVSCWGNPYTLGTAGRVPLGVPSEVEGLDDAVSLAAAGSHVCALRAEGRVVCWGSNVAGQLGDGTTNFSPVPVEVVGP